MNITKQNKGIAPLAIVGIIALVIVLAGGIYYITKQGTSGLIPNNNQNATSTCATSTLNYTLDGKVSTTTPCVSVSTTPVPSSATLLSNCEYLTQGLVNKYVSVPTQLDSSAPQSIICMYNVAGSKPGGQDVVGLQKVYSDTSIDIINKIYKMNIGSSHFKDDSSIGFTAWYAPDQKNGTVVFYFASTHMVMAISMKQSGVGLDVNLHAAESIAKEIQPKLP